MVQRAIAEGHVTEELYAADAAPDARLAHRNGTGGVYLADGGEASFVTGTTMSSTAAGRRGYV